MEKTYKEKEWLQKKYIDDKLSAMDISKIFKVNITTILYWLRKNNIPVRSNAEAQHLICGNHCNPSQEAIEWLNGELLGDGCLGSRYKYSASFWYGSKYLEYIEYVRDTLKSFGIEQAGKIYKIYHKKFGCYSYHYVSRVYPELLPVYKQWYPEGKKVIPKNLKITPLTLRQHYIGDGCLVHQRPGNGNPYIVLSTCGFLLNDIREYVKKINKLGFKTGIYKSKCISISAYSTKDFLEYIGICPVKCYEYKWSY